VAKERGGYEARDGVSRKMRLAMLSRLPRGKPVGSSVFHRPPLICWVWLAVWGVGAGQCHPVPAGCLEHPNISGWIDGVVLKVMGMRWEAVHGSTSLHGEAHSQVRCVLGRPAGSVPSGVYPRTQSFGLCTRTGRIVHPLIVADTSSVRGGRLETPAVSPWAGGARLLLYTARIGSEETLP